MAKLLIVDDDLGVLKQLKWALESDYQVFTAAGKGEALSLISSEQPQLITLDVNLSGSLSFSKEGLQLLDEIKSNNPFSKVVMITANDNKEIALEAIAKGAFDYYSKPINLEELKIILKRALYIYGLEQENRRLSEELNLGSRFQDLVGSSPQMEKVYQLIHRVAPTDATVLISGESGTGKELIARAIHFLSLRKQHPFMVINCGAIPENLLESELFGHERGAFTDAHIQRMGKLEAANRGTVFLDEIGEMSLSLQVKILRFLQERVIERVGANTLIELDLRVIAATNSDLEKRIKAGSFREDLYYRLSVVNAHLPALRERGEDAILLANFFLQKYKSEIAGKEIKGFNKEAENAILAYSWPGNVREMENRIRRAAILTDSPLIKPKALGLDSQEPSDSGKEKFSLKQARQKSEIDLIKKALDECKGNVSLAAKMLGITRPTLYDLMKKYAI